MDSKFKGKFKMNISNREKIMLIVLAVIFVFAAYYKFVFSNQVGKIKELSAKKLECKNKINELERDKFLSAKLQKDIKITNAKIYEATEDFFPSIIEEKIITILDDMIDESDIQCNSISVSEESNDKVSKEKNSGKEDKKDKANPLESLVKQYEELDSNKTNIAKGDNKDKNKEASKSKNKKDELPEAKKISITLNFNGSYENVISFIDKVKGFYKRIVINNMNLAAAETGLSGNMVLDFYAIPKFNKEDIDYNKWNFDNDYGKINVFEYNSKGTVPVESNKQNTQDKIEEKENDFLMSVKPVSSDLPTIILGKAKDKGRDTYVYADNNGVENVEIHIMKKGDKYFYKYKTTRDTYPKSANGEEKFKPVGQDINMKIYSNKRNSKNDMAGANIKVYNQTGLKFNVSIEDDDKERPRVNILKQSGNINVIKK